MNRNEDLFVGEKHCLKTRLSVPFSSFGAGNDSAQLWNHGDEANVLIPALFGNRLTHGCVLGKTV